MYNMRYLSIIYISMEYMKINREKTIQMIRLRILELHLTNTAPMFETYTNQQLYKACSIYGIRPIYYE
jgi:hypothetical protein